MSDIVWKRYNPIRGAYDVVLDSLEDCPLLDGNRMTMIAVYEHPADYPEHYVARVVADGTATAFAAITDTLEDARNLIPPWMRPVRLSPLDDKRMVEMWM